jgi:hypothetical protein
MTVQKAWYFADFERAVKESETFPCKERGAALESRLT